MFRSNAGTRDLSDGNTWLSRKKGVKNGDFGLNKVRLGNFVFRNLIWDIHVKNWDRKDEKLAIPTTLYPVHNRMDNATPDPARLGKRIKFPHNLKCNVMGMA